MSSASSAATAGAPQFVKVSLQPKGVAIVTIQRSGAPARLELSDNPVNSMNLQLWSELLSTLDALEKNKSVRGVIFTSGVEKDVFTAGNDIKELYSKSTSATRFLDFWTAQTTCLTRLYSSRLATVAAIRGACPAGGCVLAMCCDYRVMTNDVPGATIGLNEVALGISVPRYWIQLYIQQLGLTRAEQALMTGRMLTPAEAVAGGLLHAAVPKAELMPTAEKALAAFLRNPDAGRVLTKLDSRRGLAAQWQGYCKEEAQNAWKVLESPQITEVLGGVLAKLSAGAAGAAPKSKL